MSRRYLAAPDTHPLGFTSGNAPYSAMVGVRGTTGPTDHPKDFAGELSGVADALDERVAPTNLYEAQLRARLRATPDRNSG